MSAAAATSSKEPPAAAAVSAAAWFSFSAAVVASRKDQPISDASSAASLPVRVTAVSTYVPFCFDMFEASSGATAATAIACTTCMFDLAVLKDEAEAI